MENLFNFDEEMILLFYGTGDRDGTIANLHRLQNKLTEEDTELRELSDSVLRKLAHLSRSDYKEVSLRLESLLPV